MIAYFVSTVNPSIDQITLMEPGQETIEVTTAELRQILADQSAYVFDARSYLEYAISHIPDALIIAPKPESAMSERISDVAEIEGIVKDKAAGIVLYCNGPFCGKSKRLAKNLLNAGFTNVRRYQLGIPTWRMLVGLTQIELDGARYVFGGDKTAVWVDARSPEEFAAGSLPGAVNMIDKEDVVKAKDDGRLPMQDHNTRIIVFGKEGIQARMVAAEIAKNAFHNVSYFGGTVEELRQGLQG